MKKIELKVGIFVIVITSLVVGGLIYIAYSKGLFATEHTYTLFATSGEDINEGMPVLFSGFKIGRVEKLELNEQGLVLVRIKVPERHVKWIRTSSVFSLYKPLLGAPRLIVTTHDFKKPELSPAEMREIITINDINETIKKIQPTLVNVDRVVDHIEKITAKVAAKESVVEMILARPESVQSVHESIAKVRDILVKTDEQMYGSDGTIPLVRKILADLLVKLEKMNIALDNVVKISVNAADSSKDLKQLRAEIDATVIAIHNVVKELDRKIPFKKEPEITLP